MQELIITSDALTGDGKWITDINSVKANPAGQNKSPQLTWRAVDGAACYAVYMYDLSADNWLHWMAKNVTDTSIDLGAGLEDSVYIGPYPPSGTHIYEVIVYALKEKIEIYPGEMDDCNTLIEKIEEKIDAPKGKKGNIICKGKIEGTVTVGVVVSK